MSVTSMPRLLALSFAAALSAGVASAQTTVTVNASDTVIRGGTYANTVFDRQPLATKVHSSNLAYTRRTLLKFDTHNLVPAGATVQSAKLTLTISKADAETRKLGVYRLSQTFDPPYATWYTRVSGSKWTIPGGDFAEKWAETSVGATVGSKITFDVTAFVQQVVKGTYGSTSRYTRIGLVDLGTGSDTSYKEFYPSEAADPATRPTLVVVYGGTQTTAVPAPAPAPTSGEVTLKVLDWNTHYGVGTDGKYNIDRIAALIAKLNPDVVSLNEVTRYAYYNTAEDQAPRYASLLKAKTGKTWYYTYRTDNGAAKGVGNAVFSTYPIASTSHCQLSGRRVAVKAAIYVNGRLLNVWSTHLDSTYGDGTVRITEVKALQACLANYAEQKIVAGDFNAKPATTEIGLMANQYVDGWAKAVASGTAFSYPGNTSFGATRNSRIDYVWYSKGATALAVKRAEVFDSRDADGDMPSDHKPLMVNFEVR